MAQDIITQAQQGVSVLQTTGNVTMLMIAAMILVSIAGAVGWLVIRVMTKD